MIIDGKAIAEDILARTRSRVTALSVSPVVRAITVAPTKATESYLRIKSARASDAGMHLEVARLPDTASTEEVVDAVRAAGADAIIVQLPLPSSINTEEVLSAIPVGRDADLLSRATREYVNTHLLPPVAGAIREILSRADIDPGNKKAVVIGRGWLVGEPATEYLEKCGARVTVATRETENLAELLKGAEIIVSGAGVPGLIQPDMLSPGVVIIDAGTSESGGAIVGDADPECASVAAVFTPVPGGVGPIAVACLFENVALLLTGPADPLY